MAVDSGSKKEDDISVQPRKPISQTSYVVKSGIPGEFRCNEWIEGKVGALKVRSSGLAVCVNGQGVDGC
jgi:hypothetical protein